MPKKKRILFLSNRGLLPIKDGHTRRSYHILRSLAENNQVFYLSLYESPDEVSENNIRKLKSFCHDVEFISAPSKSFSAGMIYRLLRSMLSATPYTVWRHYSKTFLTRVNELISTGSFDLVHCDLLPLCYVIRDRTDIFRSVTALDVMHMKYLLMAKTSSNIAFKTFLFLESWKTKRFEKNVFSKADVGIVVSDSEKEIIQKLCPEGRFLVIENCIGMDDMLCDEDSLLQNRLVWLGGFNHFPNRQGVKYFLSNIYPLIKKALPDVSIDIVGGCVTKDLMQYAVKDGSIRFTGYVENPWRYVRRGTVFIAPILCGGGTKLKIIEAMALGKAIVTTSVGCNGIDGTNYEHFIVCDEADEFSEAVIQLLKDDALRKKIEAQSREFALTRFDYRKICEKLHNYYQSHA